MEFEVTEKRDYTVSIKSELSLILDREESNKSESKFLTPPYTQPSKLASQPTQIKKEEMISDSASVIL